MSVLQPFVMALKSIFSKKVRSFLTMLGIIIGVSAVTILVSIVQASQQKIVEQIEQMGTNKIYLYLYNEKLKPEEILSLKNKFPDYIMAITPDLSYGCRIKYGKKSFYSTVMFGNSDYHICNNYDLEEGRDITQTDVDKCNRVVVIGAAVKERLFNLIDPIGKTLKINGLGYTVVGVYKEKADSAQYSFDDILLVPYTAKRELAKATTMTSFNVKAVSSSAVNAAISVLHSYLAVKMTNNYYLYSSQEYIDEQNAAVTTMSLLLGGIAGISLIVGGIGIMNIMLVSVSERTKEIGIRKALGARRRDIISQFLVEAATLSAAGGLIGMGIGWVGTRIIGQIMFKMVTSPAQYIMFGAFLFSIALGIFFGLYPAVRASKLHPIEALRTE